jgi:hypothetical protein
MWRAFFLAIGIFSVVLGAECLVVDSFVMAGENKPVAPTTASLFNAPPPSVQKEVQPAEWAPWTFLSVGAVVILYSLTLSRPGG